ncbi:MAG: nitroreductase family protein [Roseobacter sp.]|nr:nitroreductase family protein [Roseobacter sp.]
MTETNKNNLQDLVDDRFQNAPTVGTGDAGQALLTSMLARGSCRQFQDKPVPQETLNLLCAAALASPTKSDLQQRDIIVLRDPARRDKLAELVAGQEWVAQAPVIVVFCGNNRRQRLLHDWHGVSFANDHFDAAFNAAGDAAIALGAFVIAAEAIGLGCCPISAVRNKAAAVSALLDLPQHVFPFAGLAIGYPAAAPPRAPRLPFPVTCHVDSYSEDNLRASVQAYDGARREKQPYVRQRLEESFGTKPDYSWSDDKVRQYSRAERADFGAFLRAQGFCFD